MLKLLTHLKRYAGWMLPAFALLFGQAMAELALPDYMSSLVSQGVAVGDMGYVLQKGAVMLLIALASAVCAILVGLLAARIGSGVARDLRGQVFDKVTSFSNPEFDRFSVSSLITRSTNDITQIQMFCTVMIRLVFYAPIMGVGGILRAQAKSSNMPGMTATIAVSILVMLFLIGTLMAIVIPRFKKAQKLLDRLNLVSRERLSGLLVIRAFGTEGYEEERFDNANQDLTKNHLFVNRTISLMMPVMTMVMNGVSLAVVWIASLTASNIADVGNMMAFMQYAIQIIMSFMMIALVFVILPRASVSANRICEILESPVDIKNPEKPQVLDLHKPCPVTFDHVSFRYPGAPGDVLTDISFTANPGEITAFIGSTGSGKTTLISLIPRLYDVSEGKVTIGGTDVRNLNLHHLHELISFVPQTGVLFSGTIQSNIRYGAPDISQEQVEKAAAVAQATEFIQEKPKGYEDPVAQGGSNVSGGQKQRLSIARALAKQAPVLIFDDSFSALDFKTDAALRRALAQETKGRTTLIVAQRVSTIMNADQIIVLEDGKIVGKGTHKELLKTCKVYEEIARSQLSEEEIAQ
ncbi:ABC transporter ATP-binding protein [Intestinimonas sp. MSJ-38]|uniref:ABC transporter ATP-binding protein n=1 Tax=Intestinimonas sp. MSJ-38 TaxID=2841532 RepID=UPI001C11EDBC|nr:ABC transporter ATP-binding protein [Intestinimonas sp. MSJ-38]MBU5432797.1 ABC transporter ATP-binding protein/permease [Intestinimonas sp. MSJ-38]